eukprot:TRINITY_DN6094_c0_g1_i1.p1 TRINITY_DN6094_c0_g1~~TRINITY_DN6094_c0_g1_i1.p1  ORF type:complete len:250 (+),score=45.57 TRINITY_DN6094_c0_g1_i1:142-891(+)
MNRELLSPEGLRIDGRRPNELRTIRCKMGVLEKMDGSAYFEQGNTKALASVYGPREVTYKSKALHDRVLINCTYGMAPFSTGERKVQRTGKQDRRETEVSLVLKQTFESAILTSLSPNSQIDINIQILQADGGTRCAAINATTLALIDAGIPLKDFVVACAGGCIDGVPILDLNYFEDSSGSPDLPVALLPQSGEVLMVQMDSKLPLDTFENVLNLAIEGCQKIYVQLKQVVSQVTKERVQNRGAFIFS